ncbi:unnamed protein product [Acanthoscelides obtectus]|uniref:PiggyBac transposable element-derived protein domain-containing protein n=1 Tax=Acanthoscelides obtectus TaxID=200917 RepID=A0A9P0KES7_ACAOB|nr:unnamed protein product [Acanthoscelides obtectus]CAK1656388.1 PiggyBac transposable element-derived protein 4 [Acanthoscelides obtectus]
MLADKNGSCLKFDIYTGKPSGDVEKNLGSRIVKQLCEGLENKNHLVYFDNFFNGVELMEDLKNNADTCLRNIPKFKSDRNMKRGDIEWFTSNSDLSVIKWKDKRSVFLLSNFHDPHDILKVNRKEKNVSITKVPCPKALSDYNANMNFVYKLDQNLTSYKIDRKSHKWWHRIFFFFPGCCYWVTATHALYERFPKKYNTRSCCTTAGSSHQPKRGTRRRYAYCSTKKEKQIRTDWVCSVCNVPLCLTKNKTCFQDSHRNK